MLYSNAIAHIEDPPPPRISARESNRNLSYGRKSRYPLIYATPFQLVTSHPSYATPPS
jgi:hypothetical protein